MKLIDFYPSVGTAAPGQIVPLVIETAGAVPGGITVELTIRHLAAVIETIRQPLAADPEATRRVLLWQPPPAAPRGYGLTLRLLDAAGRLIDRRDSAVDVLPGWTAYPRYGFLTDFTPGRADARETVARLARYHINGLQFYDWQYRHDRLLPPVDEFIDPLGRALSLPTVRRLLDAAHDAGMAAMPYLAVYAASLEYARAHPEQALYGPDGQPLTFEAFLGLMDPTAGGPWAAHLLAECDRTLAALPFDGLHVDQYGEPRSGDNARGAAVDLPAAFVDFLRALKERHPGRAAVFNAVGNWPIDALAAGPQDFLYIEVWPPSTGYRDVWEIVAGARRKSGGRPVVIALYLPAERPANNRLADAVILSAGGSRIEIGEGDRLLADPYFPRHQALSPELHDALRRYADFAVRYGEWLGPAAADLDPACAAAPDGVWAIPRRAGDTVTVSLLNVAGLGDRPAWDMPHAEPAAWDAMPVTVEVAGRVRAAWWASADHETHDLSPLAWRQDGARVLVELPGLTVWSMAALQLEPAA